MQITSKSEFATICAGKYDQPLTKQFEMTI